MQSNKASMIIRLLTLVSLFGVLVMPAGLFAQDSGTEPGILYSKAVNHFIEADYDKARELANQVLESNPDHDRSRKLIDYLEELESNKDGVPEDVSVEEFAQDMTPPNAESQAQLSDGSDASAQPDSPAQTVEINQSDTASAQSQVPGFNPAPESAREQSIQEPPEISAEPKQTIEHRSESPEVEGRTRAVHSLVAHEYEDRVRVVVEANRSVDFMVSEIYDPAMIVVDIPNSVDRLPESPLKLGLKDVLRARHSQYREDPINTTRLVLDLERWHDNFQVYQDSPGDRIVIDIFDVEQMFPEAQEDPEIEDIMFQAHPEKYYELSRVSGSDQSLNVPDDTSDSMVARFVDGNGEPLRNEDVEVSVREGEAHLGSSPDSTDQEQLTLQTDEDGRVNFYAQATEEAGPVEVVARTPEYDLMVNYKLTVQPGDPVELARVAGHEQEVLFGETAQVPLTVEARDQYGNPVPGVRVDFDAITRGVFFDVDKDETGKNRRTTTNEHGRAQVDIFRVSPDKEVNELGASLANVDGDQADVTMTVFGRPNLVSLSLENAPLGDVLRTLSEVANLDIVFQAISEDASAPVNLSMNDVAPLRAMDTVLEVQNPPLARVMDGGIIKVVDRQQAIERGIYEGFKINVVKLENEQLKSGEGDDIVDRLVDSDGLQLGENGDIIAHPRTNEVVIHGEPAMVQKMTSLIKAIDNPGRLYENYKFVNMEGYDVQRISDRVSSILSENPLQNFSTTGSAFDDLSPDDVREIVRPENVEELTEAGGSIIPFTNFDQILLFGSPDFIGVAEQMILDIREKGEDFIAGQSFRWYTPKALAFTNAIEIASQIGQVQVKTESYHTNSILLSSTSSEALDNAVETLERIDDPSVADGGSDVIKIEGVSAQEVAQRVNSILVQGGGGEDQELEIELIPIDQDILPEGVDEESLGLTVLPQANAIVVIGSPEIRTVIRNLVRSIEDSVDQLDEVEWKWYSPSEISLSKLEELILRTGNVRVEEILQEQNLILARAPNTDEFDTLDGILEDVRQNKPSSQYELMVYSPQFVNASGLANDLSAFLQREEGADDVFDLLAPGDSNEQLVVHADDATNRVVLAVHPRHVSLVQEIINKIDQKTNTDSNVLTYAPSTVSGTELASQLQANNIGPILYQSENRISILVQSDREQEIRNMINQIDESGYTVQQVELNNRRASKVADVIGKLWQRGTSESGSAPSLDIQSASGPEAVAASASVFENPNVSFTTDPSMNRIVFTAPRQNAAKIRNVIKKFDQRPKQIFLEATLIEHRIDDSQGFESLFDLVQADGNRGGDISRGAPSRGARESLSPDDLIFDSSSGTLLPGVTLSDVRSAALPETFDPALRSNVFSATIQTQPNSTQDGVKALFNFFEEYTNSEVMSQPRISTLNNEPAAVSVSETRFEREVTITDAGTRQETIGDEVPATTELEITPSIMKNRQVNLDIALTDEQFQSPDPTTLATDERELTTNLIVDDGQTIMLGGLIQEEESISESGVPYLKDIPFLGKLFESTTQSMQKNELVIVMTPQIIESRAEADRILRENSSEKIREHAGIRVNINTASRTTLERLLEKEKWAPPLDDLNDYTSNELVDTIIQYRKQNGPFTSFGQLIDDVGTDSEKLGKLIDRLALKVDANSVTTQELARIRGIDFELAHKLTKERSLRVTFQDMDEVAGLLRDAGVSDDHVDTLVNDMFYIDDAGEVDDGTSISTDEDVDIEELDLEQSSDTETLGTTQSHQEMRKESGLPVKDDVQVEVETGPSESDTSSNDPSSTTRNGDQMDGGSDPSTRNNQ